MTTSTRAWLGCALLLLAGAAPAQGTPAAGASAAVAASAPAAPAAVAFRSDQVRFQYAVFYLPAPQGDALQRLNALLAASKSGPMLTDSLPNGPTRLALVRARIEKDPMGKYRPPDLQLLQHLGRGLSAEQARALQQTRQVLVLDFAHPAARAFEALKTADELVEKLAREAGGLVWDEQTREVFSPDAWKQRRVDSWAGGLPHAQRHVTIYAYNKGQFARAVSLGMAKFGLPDIVVQEFSWSASRPMGSLVNALAQSLVEGAPASSPGPFRLDVAAIKHPQVQKDLAAASKSGATGVAQVSFAPAAPEKGDPANRLIEVVFPALPGADRHASYNALLRGTFGGDDVFTTVRADAPAMVEASRKAREKLPDLKAAFAAGLAPGEFIQLKMPFRTPQGGLEYMWVEVSEWKGNRIVGVLKNQPRAIPSLRGGQVVEVKEEDVFDFLRVMADGRREGNETGKVAEQVRQR